MGFGLINLPRGAQVFKLFKGSWSTAVTDLEGFIPQSLVCKCEVYNLLAVVLFSQQIKYVVLLLILGQHLG